MKNKFRVSLIALAICPLLLSGCSSRVGETEALPAPAAVSEPDGETETADAGIEAVKPETETADPEETETVTAEAEAAAAGEEDPESVLEAYASFIDGLVNDGEHPFLSYAVIHLDDDAVPELAVSYGDSHPDGVSFYCRDGAQVKEVFFTGSMGRAFYERGTGIIYGWYTGMGETYHTIGIVRNGEVTDDIRVAIATQYDDNFEETGYKYYTSDAEFDDKEISAEEYEEILAPYVPAVRDYRELEYGSLIDAHSTADTLQALRTSLAEEDDLPKPDMDFYSMNVVTAEP